MKRAILLLTIALFVTIFFTGCNNDYEYVEEERVAMISLDKFEYARVMRFDFRIIVDGERGRNAQVRARTDPNNELFDPFYTELVFVHSEADAEGFPDNVIAAWPTEQRWTRGMIAALNYYVTRERAHILFRDNTSVRGPIILEDLGLSLPITVADLVDNWEQVNNLWWFFTNGERQALESETIRYVITGTNIGTHLLVE